jgi:hypothetical protein
MPRTYSREEIRSEMGPENYPVVNMWLERGDGIAVFQNEDLGHRQLGHRKYVSFGSSHAQLTSPEPPPTLPDIGGAVNWRYQLVGTYRGASL